MAQPRSPSTRLRRVATTSIGRLTSVLRLQRTETSNTDQTISRYTGTLYAVNGVVSDQLGRRHRTPDRALRLPGHRAR